MYYTGIHPMTGKRVAVTTDYHEKQLQRALLQYSRPENANLVREALKLAGREDLIGSSPECLVRAAFGRDGRGGAYTPDAKTHRSSGSHSRSSAARASGYAGKAQGAKSPSKTKPGSRQGGKAQSGATSQRSSVKDSAKLRRIFGEESARILRDAERMASGGTKKSSGVRRGSKKRS
jgi:hypothetical protein